MEHKCKRNQLEVIQKALYGIGQLPGEKISYFFSKNINLLKREFERMNKHIESIRPEKTEKITEFLKEDEQIHKDFTNKDDQGNPIIKNGQYDIPQENIPSLKFALAQLADKYPDESKAFDDYKKALDTYMTNDVTVELHTISRGHLPEQLTGFQRVELEFLISD
jgi:hypothetical protein